jgi:hypothetical protein
LFPDANHLEWAPLALCTHWIPAFAGMTMVVWRTLLEKESALNANSRHNHQQYPHPSTSHPAALPAHTHPHPAS